MFKSLILKKGEDRRIQLGHPWVFSNEIDTKKTPLNTFAMGEEVVITSQQGVPLGKAYVNPHSLIAARLFSNNAHTTLNTDFFIVQLKQALALRQRLFQQDYYRWVFSEADGLPGLIIDRFNDHLVAQLNTAGMDKCMAPLQEAILHCLPNTKSILLRNDTRAREREGLVRNVEPLYGHPPEEVLVEENGARYSMPLWKGQKTGWFYDHRLNRTRLAPYVHQKKVLDVFSYLGAWGIQAAMQGATQVDCIDASALACEYITKNAALNGVSGSVMSYCEDAFEALKRRVLDNNRYDVIILDPPAFVKKQKDKRAGLLAYQRINELALRLLASDGVLITCSCSMLISTEELVSSIIQANKRTGFHLQILEQGHQGPDHPIHLCVPESNYLKTIVMRLRQ